MFIVLEGLDGSGKSTQANILSKNLTNMKISNICTCQPTKSPIGIMAREHTQGKGDNLQNETVGLLFAADSIQHLTNQIAPALLQGQFVVCDRYYYSNMAYQGVDDIALERVINYNQVSMEIGKPDITFFLDVLPETCMARIAANREEFSIFDTLPRLTKLRERYMASFNRLKATENIVIINGDTKSQDEISHEILGHIQALQ